MAELRIGDVAARAGVSIDSVRFYERLRLLPRAARTAGGFRLFSSETVETGTPYQAGAGDWPLAR